jgi:hypothetical protein
VLIVGIAVVALAPLIALVAVRRRRPREDDGVVNFRRHIDALSPEARREVHERARRHGQGRG